MYWRSGDFPLGLLCQFSNVYKPFVYQGYPPFNVPARAAARHLPLVKKTEPAPRQIPDRLWI